MTYEQQTIARNTRNGRVLWQHVAAQLGCSEPTARAQFDGAYRRPYECAAVHTPIEAEKPASLYRGRGRADPGLDDSLIRILSAAPLDLTAIIQRSGHTRGTVINHLGKLRDAKKIQHLKHVRKWASLEHRA